MSDEKPEGFKEGVWYTVRVKPGGTLKKSRAQQTPYLDLELEVTTGPMWGSILKGEIYFAPPKGQKKGTLARAEETMRLLGFDVRTDDWTKIGQIVAGKEVQVEPQVQLYNNEWRARANNWRKIKLGPDGKVAEDEPLSVEVARLYEGHASEMKAAMDRDTAHEEAPAGGDEADNY